MANTPANDAMGNMTCRDVNTTSSTQSCNATQTGATMTYDSEGHLTTWQAPSGSSSADSAQFLYDSAGNRILQRATSNGVVSDTITFDGYTDVTISNVITSTTKYYTVGGQKVAMRKDGTLSYLLTDLLGSASVALHADGTVQAVNLYSPYGRTLYTDGIMPTPYDFTGQRLDVLTGLLYYGARYYDPVSGRFISADTVEDNGNGSDAYAYVRGNPETAVDPTGHGACSEGGGCTYGPGAPPPPDPTSWGGSGSSNGGGGDSGAGWCNSTNCYDGSGNGVSTTGGGSTGITSAAPPADSGCDFRCQVQNKINQAKKFIAEKLGFSRPSAQSVEQACSTVILENSFAYNTKVATSKGEREIGSLKFGDMVKSYDPKTHKVTYQPIQHVWINHDNDLVDLTVSYPSTKQHGGTSSQETKDILHTNAMHPFLTAEKGFVRVRDIHVGMHLIGANGKSGKIVAWKSVPGAQTMYNLTVAQYHTYTVGTGQWIVHNSLCSDQMEAFYGFPTETNNDLTLQDIIDGIPADAVGLKARFLYRTDRIPDGGLEIQYRYEGAKVTIRIHGPDSGTGNPEGNAATSWVVRIIKGSKSYDINGNEYPKGIFNSDDPAAQDIINDLHIPIADPPFPLYPESEPFTFW